MKDRIGMRLETLESIVFEAVLCGKSLESAKEYVELLGLSCDDEEYALREADRAWREIRKSKLK